MSVIAFRPRVAKGLHPRTVEHPAVTGTFRSPRGRSGVMSGFLRVQRLVLTPRGAFLTGVFTGELRDADASLIGVDSRRVTAPVDLVRDADGYTPVVRPLHLDLMGISVEVDAVRIDPGLAFPRLDRAVSRFPGRRGAEDDGRSPS